MLDRQFALGRQPVADGIAAARQVREQPPGQLLIKAAAIADVRQGLGRTGHVSPSHALLCPAFEAPQPGSAG